MTLLLAGCSLGDMVLPSQDDAVAGPMPPYRKLIAAGLSGIVGDPKRAGTLEISGLQRVDSLKGPAWLVCLRAIGASTTSATGSINTDTPTTTVLATPLYYAVFIQDERIIDSRLAVRADRCEQQSFESFNPAKS